MIATRVTDTHYLPHNHDLILSSSDSKMVFRQRSLSSRVTGTWQMKRDRVTETLWGPSGSRVAMRPTCCGRALQWEGGAWLWLLAVVMQYFLSFPRPAGSWKHDSWGCFPRLLTSHHSLWGAGKKPEADENSSFRREPSGWRKCSWLWAPTVPPGSY